MSSEKFYVIRKGSGFQIRGVDGYQLIVGNRFDAERHCSFLNEQERIRDELLEENIQYYTVLSKIKFIVDDIHQCTGELHILEKAIRIKNLLKEVL